MAEMVSCTCMDGECMDMSWGNQRLQSLSEQLRSYNSVGTPWPVAKQEADENDGRVVLHQSVNESTAERSHISDGDRSRERRAAVLICLFEGDQGELRVILTQRSYNLTTHPGEVALPGGKMEEGDVDDSATALRESMEEIGLDPSLVQVVALLEPFISKHLLRVIPVVGLLANKNEFKTLLNTDEVQAIFDVPLEMFLKVIHL
ncbi:nudix hydrolase 15, mitochondrial-like [Magnolia sinica]|uniref:nudix hydrolase 15, mitochondrial-like n=1 Tax=Magnolia sinica TaxID=86752 RepID=UPI002657D511|nr:nudix hydrolase 15, mitochondrial-like [Magnolia sinica]